MVSKEELLAGRKAVDDYLEAHSQLHQPIKDGKALAVDHSEIMEKMLSELKAQGFESQDAFRDANGLACGLERMRCYKMEGTCDGCKGRERGCDPSCIEEIPYFDSQSKTLNAQKSSREHRADIEQKLSDGTLTLEKLKGYGTHFFTWRKFPDNVPPNCSIKYVKVAEPRFDIYWGIRIPAIDPEQYEEIKERWRL